SWTRKRWRWRQAVRADAPTPPRDAGGEQDSYAVFPYSVGLLQAYAQKHAARPRRYEFLPQLYKRLPVSEAVGALSGADVVGFSAYIWNIQISLEIARRLKQRRPDTLVVFGGPQVPDRAEEFLRNHTFIDVAVHGEGERVFTSILERCETRGWEGVASISYLKDDGVFVNHPKAARMTDLSLVPSPYLENVFEPLMRANPREKWAMLWETNRGCPFACTFCDWGSAVASKVYRFEPDRLTAELTWFAERQGEFVFCCDANFGILPRDYDLATHAVASKLLYGYPRSLSVQNTKNATERAYRIQKLLADSGMNTGVTISLQSVDPETLRSVKRENISLDSFEELQRRYTRDRVTTYTDMILALPGETYDSFAGGVERVISNGQHNRILFYNLSILPNAEMGDPGYQRRHGMISVAQKVLNMHDEVGAEDGGVDEFMEIVVGTSTMPPEDWVRAKAFWWMTDLLFFGRLAPVPFVLLRELYGVGYRELIELFLRDDSGARPILSGIRRAFFEKAREIQRGGGEYVAGDGLLPIWWPADQYALQQLCAGGKLEAFYEEIGSALATLLREKSIDHDPLLLREAIELNRALFRLPFFDEDLTLDLSHNVWEFYQSIVRGERVALERRPSSYRVVRSRARLSSWEDWCEHVVECQNRKAGFFYGVAPLAPREGSPTSPKGSERSVKRKPARVRRGARLPA
ncbi:MAG: cobalamin-dependent protein, partial [Acidobacteriota bacterium]|nr:cobalamin-dependent protein [Acidobacteriota bacterium]